MKNRITLVGKVTKRCEVAYKRYGIIFYKMTVTTTRASMIEDDITVVTAQKNEFEEGTVVSVVGHMQTENYDTGDGVKHLRVYVYSDYIFETDEETDNNCEIAGKICKNTGLRNTPSGRVICSFIVVVKSDFDSNYYIPVIAWGNNAAAINDTPIGTTIDFSGRLQSRIYRKNKELKRVLEVSLERFEVVSYIE